MVDNTRIKNVIKQTSVTTIPGKISRLAVSKPGMNALNIAGQNGQEQDLQRGEAGMNNNSPAGKMAPHSLKITAGQNNNTKKTIRVARNKSVARKIGATSVRTGRNGMLTVIGNAAAGKTVTGAGNNKKGGIGPLFLYLHTGGYL
jgi:hypothetical protein